MKKSVSLVVALSICLVSPVSNVHAAAIDNSTYSSQSDALVHNQEVNSPFMVIDGKITPLTQQQLKEFEAQSAVDNMAAKLNLSNQPIVTVPSNSSNLVSPNVTTTSTAYTYKQLSYKTDVKRADLNRRITAAVRNQSGSTATRTISFSASQSYTSSIEFSLATQKSAVTAGITGGSSWQNAVSGADSITVNVPNNYYSWLEFYPIMNYSYGTFTTDVYSITDTGSTSLVSSTSKNVNIYIPKNNGTKLPDGVYTPKSSLNNPV